MKKIFRSLLLISIGVITGILITNNVYSSYYSSIIYANTTTSNLVKSNSIAMMLETDIDSNEYYLSTDTSWPTSRYTFNENLSKCENGATLSWDSDNNQVLMTGSSSDKCYIYFDIISKIDEVCDSGDNLSQCIQELYNETGEGTVGIYYHDGAGDYTNADLEAGDYSYRYSGASVDVSNFVCFGSDDCADTDNLYRIIGAFKNENGDYEIKLIKYDYCTSDMCGTNGDYKGLYSSGEYQGNSTNNYLGYNYNYIGNYYWNHTYKENSYTNSGYYNDWNYSALNTVNLNTYYLDVIGLTWSNLIADHTWIIGGNTSDNIYNANAQIAFNSELINPNITTGILTTTTSKVGLIYVPDYYYSISPIYWSYPGWNEDISLGYVGYTEYNWIFMGLYEWTITRSASNYANMFYVGCAGNIYESVSDVYDRAIRPTFYLSSSVEYSSGTGAQSDPIILVTN